MKIFRFILAGFLILTLATCSNKKKTDTPDTIIKELSQDEITKGFDIYQDLMIDLMMDIPSATYKKDNEGQYSILFIPKSEEQLEKYKDFDKKHSIELSKDLSGNLYYDDATFEKINKILRADLNIKDFNIIGRYIPYHFLVIDTDSPKGEYSVSMPYEMKIYKLTDNKWEYIETTLITDIVKYEEYESLSKYENLLNKE
ncbi:hypothetical protein [Prevotella sp. 10(H)]|uniref:hypothetical protein n=1 Tax=Prevotella sp. 10(H) TaxID=1158294 RepID=UPI0004A70C2D|nr:hypothetical protein [Prevotella sp. 10(H)]